MGRGVSTPRPLVDIAEVDDVTPPNDRSNSATATWRTRHGLLELDTTAAFKRFREQ